jgi:hypothetical protein
MPSTGSHLPNYAARCKMGERHRLHYKATPSPLNNVITIDDDRIKNHLDRVVRGSGEETLNARAS